MSEWQPIETAPKDGTEFLGYHPKYGWIGTVRFDEPNDSLPKEVTLDHLFMIHVNCTHWMPLPEPPKG